MGCSVGEYAFGLGGGCHLSVYLFLKYITILFTFHSHVMFSFIYHNKHSVRGMSWEKLENPHGKLTLIRVVNLFLDV